MAAKIDNMAYCPNSQGLHAMCREMTREAEMRAEMEYRALELFWKDPGALELIDRIKEAYYEIEPGDLEIFDLLPDAAKQLMTGTSPIERIIPGNFSPGPQENHIHYIEEWAVYVNRPTEVITFDVHIIANDRCINSRVEVIDRLHYSIAMHKVNGRGENACFAPILRKGTLSNKFIN